MSNTDISVSKVCKIFKSFGKQSGQGFSLDGRVLVIRNNEVIYSDSKVSWSYENGRLTMLNGHGDPFSILKDPTYLNRSGKVHIH